MRDYVVILINQIPLGIKQHKSRSFYFKFMTNNVSFSENISFVDYETVFIIFWKIHFILCIFSVTACITHISMEVFAFINQI